MYLTAEGPRGVAGRAAGAVRGGRGVLVQVPLLAKPRNIKKPKRMAHAEVACPVCTYNILASVEFSIFVLKTFHSIFNEILFPRDSRCGKYHGAS